mmetsp:Transcript_5928/g.17070  ORF Transcript_5928/g.17070 Transcript_5928/m.17070 type:complete len:221 (+) Transcript_5928:2160-2822(+)
MVVKVSANRVTHHCPRALVPMVQSGAPTLGSGTLVLGSAHCKHVAIGRQRHGGAEIGGIGRSLDAHSAWLPLGRRLDVVVHLHKAPLAGPHRQRVVLRRQRQTSNRAGGEQFTVLGVICSIPLVNPAVTNAAGRSHRQCVPIVTQIDVLAHFVIGCAADYGAAARGPLGSIVAVHSHHSVPPRGAVAARGDGPSVGGQGDGDTELLVAPLTGDAVGVVGT